jgi:hypothetical protein
LYEFALPRADPLAVVMEEMQQRLRRFGLEESSNRLLEADLALSHRTVREGGGMQMSGGKRRSS